MPPPNAPRLILCDWLEENREEDRAALIRWMLRVPSYQFFWNQSDRAKRPRHEHRESIQAIRGLKARLATFCAELWAPRPAVERVIYRRGFAETITLPAAAFLDQAAQLFTAEPIEHVYLRDLYASHSFDRPGMFEARLATHHWYYDHWPAVLFPGQPEWSTLYYLSVDGAMADLSRHAAAYGRRAAGVKREPPPLPKKM
jgi:uncharacterized protein (TIGR02996 family)